ncbi:MAG: phosphohydrolase [Candidatus Peribacteria bacterium]|nr:phosphohydrolase [Candidatus Peribacteria bacterium]
MISAYLEPLALKIKDIFSSDSSGHDFDHLQRVVSLALKIQETEGGDALVIAAAALLHDLHRLRENKTGEFCAPVETLPQAKVLLESVQFPTERIDPVLHCIEHHEQYSFSKGGKTVTDIETLILQDADNLDAMGAIGIARTFAFSGAHAVPFWTPEVPFDRLFYDEKLRDPSVLHHFHSKLLRLKESMNTETGKQMAERRHLVMESYVEEFMREWKGVV